MSWKHATFASMALASLGVTAQPTANRPPEDLVPTILMSQAMADEFRQACVRKYPELEAKIEREYRAWPLFSIRIAISVNGREYMSPLAVAMRDVVRREIARKDEQRFHGDCSHFAVTLDKASSGLSREALAPFLD